MQGKYDAPSFMQKNQLLRGRAAKSMYSPTVKHFSSNDQPKESNINAPITQVNSNSKLPSTRESSLYKSYENLPDVRNGKGNMENDKISIEVDTSSPNNKEGMILDKRDEVRSNEHKESHDNHGGAYQYRNNSQQQLVLPSLKNQPKISLLDMVTLGQSESKHQNIKRVLHAPTLSMYKIQVLSHIV